MPLTDFFSSNNNYNEKITTIIEAMNITIIELQMSVPSLSYQMSPNVAAYSEKKIIKATWLFAKIWKSKGWRGASRTQ